MTRRSNLALLAFLATGALSAACSDSEAPAEDHTPVTFLVLVNGTPVADDTVRLTQGGIDTVRIKFVNAAGDTLDDVEAGHFSALTFTPGTDIAAVMDPAHHFRHAVQATAASGTAGDLDIGYGHDALADEHSFGTKFKVE